MKKFVILSIGVGLSALASLLFLPADKAMASFSVPLNQGFFSYKTYANGTSTWEDVIQSCGGDVFPSGISKGGFIDKVMSFYNGGCSGGHNSRGAKFLIKSMLGYNRSSDLTSDEIQTWQKLINSNRVSISTRTQSISLNTGYFSSVNDFVFVNDDRTMTVTSLYYDGKPWLSFKSDCGNFVSNYFPSLWSVTPQVQPAPGDRTISVAPNEVQTMTWQGWGEVDYGTTDTSVAVTMTPSWSGSQTKPSIPSGSSYPKRSASGTVTRTVTTADVGKQFCVTTTVNPGGRNITGLDSAKTTARSCYTVVAGTQPPNPCRPVKKTIEAMTYPGASNGYVSIATYTPTYKAKTDVYDDPTIWTGTNIWNKVPLTVRNTDGNVHGITLTDTTNHFTGLQTLTHTYYRSIQISTRYWIPETYKKQFYCSAYSKKRPYGCIKYSYTWVVDRPGQWSGWSGWSTHVPIYRWDDNGGIPGVPGGSDSAQYRYDRDSPVYWYSKVYYSNDPVVYNITRGTMPVNTNNIGTSRLASSSPIGPCFDYKLTANIDNFYSRREAEESFGVSGSVGSLPYTPTDPKWSGFAGGYGTHTKSKNTKWVITLMKVPVNVSPPSAVGGTTSSLEPCSYFDSSGVSTCSVAQQGTAVFGGGVGGPNGGGGGVGGGYTVPDEYAGTKLCYALSIFPNQSDPAFTSVSWGGADQWYHAAFNPGANCIIVVKKPKFQVRGGDLAVGKKVTNSTTTTSGSVYAFNSALSGRVYGSWSEYGILATDGISGMASGSNYANGMSGGNSCTSASLTFANRPANSTSCSGSFGGYTFKTPMREFASYYPTSSTTPKLSGSINVSSLGAGIYTSSDSSVTVNGGYAGSSIVLNMPNTDVTITGDINANTAPLTAIGQLGQVVIIAKNIYIRSNVEQVDAWLIAQSGTVNTCSDVAEDAQLSVNICSRQLKVNGPVSAGRLILKRTYGSDPGAEKGVPAEIFNLRADTYLWIYANSLKDNRLRTTYVVEQPPRL